MKFVLKNFLLITIGLSALSLFQATESSAEDFLADISKAQFAFEQQALFHRADKNADGVVSSDELLPLRSQRSEQELEKRFNELDTDFSGFLSKDEIFLAHDERDRKVRRGRKNSGKSQIQRFDLDGNGEVFSYEIDQVEVDLEKKLIERRNEINFSNEGFTSALLRLEGRSKELLDLDSNGLVSEYEMLEHVRKLNDKERKRLKRLRDGLLKKFDLDGNGDILSSEIKQIESVIDEELIERHSYIAQKDFEYKDSDSNDIISLEEYKNSHKNPEKFRDIISNRGPYLSRDKNDDGDIYYSENEEFIELLFKKLDVDTNNYLSVKEQSNFAFKKYQKFNFSKLYITK